jgi:hypothetical protein
MKLPRFSLRELFLLVVIAAMGCGWWVDRTRFNKLNRTHQVLTEDLVSERWYSEMISKHGLRTR